MEELVDKTWKKSVLVTNVLSFGNFCGKRACEPLLVLLPLIIVVLLCVSRVSGQIGGRALESQTLPRKLGFHSLRLRKRSVTPFSSLTALRALWCHLSPAWAPWGLCFHTPQILGLFLLEAGGIGVEGMCALPE